MEKRDFVYLDNAATTFCSERVCKELSKYYSQPHGNPSAIHFMGHENAKILENARKFFADTFFVKPKQVIFTASGTEANNLAISGVLRKMGLVKKRPVILSSPVEHSSVKKTVEFWEKQGVDLQYLRVNCDGKVDVEDLRSKLSPKVALVTVMAVNNEIGTIEPIQEIGDLINEVDPEIIFHVDAVQAFGKVPLEFNDWKIDLMSLSSHKIHGPVGAGALIMREGVTIEPLLYGGGQENGYRSGTESVGMVYGFYVAASDMMERLDANYKRVSLLRDRLRRGIEELPYKKKINTPEESSPYILNVSFLGCPSEVTLRMLEEERVLTSAGSSCNMKRHRPSGVLSQIGCSEDEMKSALRFSFCPRTTDDNIDRVLDSLSRVLSRLEKIAV